MALQLRITDLNKRCLLPCFPPPSPQVLFLPCLHKTLNFDLKYAPLTSENKCIQVKWTYYCYHWYSAVSYFLLQLNRKCNITMLTLHIQVVNLLSWEILLKRIGKLRPLTNLKRDFSLFLYRGHQHLQVPLSLNGIMGVQHKDLRNRLVSQVRWPGSMHYIKKHHK